MFSCAYCEKNVCLTGTLDRAPTECPSLEEAYTDVEALYDEEELKIARTAALVEAEGYCKNTRVEEIMSFAHKMGVKKLGLAFCSGLKNEALIFTKILTENGFEVVSAKCKMGAQPKERLGVKDEEKIRPGQFEAMCNPAAQAEYLDAQGAELSVILGLCVGHDTLFIRHSKAMVTVLAAKDRVLAHNPLGALYMADGYYKRLHHFSDSFAEEEKVQKEQG